MVEVASKQRLVGCPSRSMSGECQCRERIAMIAPVASDEIDSLWLAVLDVELPDELQRAV